MEWLVVEYTMVLRDKIQSGRVGGTWLLFVEASYHS